MTDAVSGLIQGIATLLLEISGLVVAILVMRRLLPAVGIVNGALAIATAVVVAVVAGAVTAEDLASSSTAIAQAPKSLGATSDGIDHCFAEDGAGTRIPFLRWLRARVPPYATYVVTTSGAPDAWCVALTLLPRLPAFGRDRPQWLVALGVVPPSMQAALKRHDGSVTLYAPGMGIQRLDGGR